MGADQPCYGNAMAPLLRPGDPPAFFTHNESGAAPLLLCCDHASRAVPASLGDLGIASADLDRHIGWDIGALDTAQALAGLIDAPLVASGYSRLVIDCNRWPSGEGSIPETSDGTVVPANRALAAADADARASACFWPYHNEVERQLDRVAARHERFGFVVVHSCTPVMNGFHRPWHIGILWDDDPRLPVPLMAALRRDPALCVGDNEPYSARASYEYSFRAHAQPRGLPFCSLEIRYDMVDTPEKAGAFARRIVGPLREALAAALT